MVCGPLWAWTLEGRIVHVSDGDSVTLLDAQRTHHRIRLVGIDAPERDQAHGEAARDALARTLQGRRVSARCRKTDRYGRALCSVHLGQQDIGLVLLQAGLAWHYSAYAAEQPSDEAARYAGAQAEARSARRGLWAEPDPLPPWRWREQGRRGE